MQIEQFHANLVAWFLNLLVQCPPLLPFNASFFQARCCFHSLGVRGYVLRGCSADYYGCFNREIADCRSTTCDPAHSGPHNPSF